MSRRAIERPRKRGSTMMREMQRRCALMARALRTGSALENVPGQAASRQEALRAGRLTARTPAISAGLPASRARRTRSTVAGAPAQ